MPPLNRLSIRVDVSAVSSKNIPIISTMLTRYDVLQPSELLESLLTSEITGLSRDYALLIRHIRDTLLESKVGLLPSVIDSINRAIKADSFEHARDILVHDIGEGDAVFAQYIIPKIMELNNVYRNLAFLNSCPGASGKPNNSIKLAELTA